MQNPFIIYPRPVSASLNRVRVAVLPAAVTDSNLVGKTGYDLLSMSSVVERIEMRRVALRLPAHLTDMFRGFDDCFRHSEPMVRLTAKQMAVQYGRCLATILLTLKEAHPANRAARPEWGDPQWAYWQTINQVWLGGGVMAGQFGQHVVVAARQILHEAGYADYQLELTPFPAQMALVGAASMLAPSTETALLLDFGHTQIKRAVAVLVAGELHRLHLLAPLPAACGSVLSAGPDQGRAEAHMEHLTAVLALTQHQLTQAGWQPQEVVAAMACNLYQGHPGPEEWGCYGRLQELTPHLQTHLADLWQRLSGQTLPFRLLQDAQAAALAHRGAAHAAVLTLGSAIGIGFPDDVV
ncbi:MAG: hypothetical protein H6658_00060 [Ardenticatenaceae bacterium]|nr:hypothetical protein [Ardenticatenaceae bacterium]